MKEVDATNLNWVLNDNYSAKNCDWSWEKHECSGICGQYGRVQLPSKTALANKVASNYLSYCQTVFSLLRSVAICKLITINGEEPILSGNYNIGFVDFKIEVKSTLPQDSSSGACYFSRTLFLNNILLYVEVKPKVQSLGELLRQINLYRSHVEGGFWIVLTQDIPDDFIKILQTQEIYVYKLTIEESEILASLEA
jgi:hypothetical protein